MVYHPCFARAISVFAAISASPRRLLNPTASRASACNARQGFRGTATHAQAMLKEPQDDFAGGQRRKIQARPLGEFREQHGGYR